MTLLRPVVLAAGLAAAVAAAWLLPALDRPNDRFSVALRLLEDKRPNDAAILFENADWRGIAAYRAERYRHAVVAFLDVETVRNLYNAGNSYALIHEWDGAKAAYRKVLLLDPEHDDARHNLDVVSRAQAREQELLEATRPTRRLGDWRDGEQDGASDTGDRDARTAEGESAGENPSGAAHARSARSAPGGISGTPGERRMSRDAAAGGTSGRADSDPGQLLAGGGGRAAILQESRLSAELLLRRINDNPARVLAARLREIHRGRQDGAAQ